MPSSYALIVEDDPDGQEVVTRMLRHHRLTCDVAPSAEDALNLLASNHYTIAIIDLALPAMDGWTLLQRIQTTPSYAAMPCVAITSYHSAEVAVQAIRAGFRAYFPKPLEATSFVRELQRVCT